SRLLCVLQLTRAFPCADDNTESLSRICSKRRSNAGALQRVPFVSCLVLLCALVCVCVCVHYMRGCVCALYLSVCVCVCVRTLSKCVCVCVSVCVCVCVHST